MSDENKPMRYLKYAIGEILLVVIGILIALQINDANDRRKTESVKQNYYKQIIVDLDKEITNIESRIGYLDTCITAFEVYNTFVSSPDLELLQVFEAITKVPVVSNYVYFNSNTIQTLESTGEIKMIPEDLRNKLTALNRKQERISLIAKGNYEIYLNSLKKSFELGYVRLGAQKPEVKGLEYQDNIAEIIMTQEAGFMFKNFTDEQVIKSLSQMLLDIDEIKELILREQKR